jgi:hypothetical protein
LVVVDAASYALGTALDQEEEVATVPHDVRELNIDAIARKLRDLLIDAGAASESDDFFTAACKQLTPRSDHPQPCLEATCRPCAHARSLLVICDHVSQTMKSAKPVGELERAPHELKRLAADVLSVHRKLVDLEAKLAKHVEAWDRMHAVVDRMGPRGHRADAHDALCVRPKAALEATRHLMAQLADLPEGLVRDLRPEVRAIGHRPPDALLTDLVRHFARARMTK